MSELENKIKPSRLIIYKSKTIFCASQPRTCQRNIVTIDLTQRVIYGSATNIAASVDVCSQRASATGDVQCTLCKIVYDLL